VVLSLLGLTRAKSDISKCSLAKLKINMVAQCTTPKFDGLEKQGSVRLSKQNFLALDKGKQASRLKDTHSHYGLVFLTDMCGNSNNLTRKPQEKHIPACKMYNNVSVFLIKIKLSHSHRLL
jgi:PIN domain nuclease of toxin-antitoxin system